MEYQGIPLNLLMIEDGIPRNLIELLVIEDKMAEKSIEFPMIDDKTSKIEEFVVIVE